MMDPGTLIAKRDEALAAALAWFRARDGVLGVFLAGSLPAGRADHWSDLDLRVVVKPEAHAGFLRERASAPRQWGELLFNTIHPQTIHAVSHFRPFLKVDVFYYRADRFVPTCWLTLPTRILHDPDGLVADVIGRSAGLPFRPEPEAVERSISFGIATAHEVYRRAQRGELIYATELLAGLRRQLVEAECHLREKPFENVERTVSAALLQTLAVSAAALDRDAILSALAGLITPYRELIAALHDRYALATSLTAHQEALELVTRAPGGGEQPG